MNIRPGTMFRVNRSVAVWSSPLMQVSDDIMEFDRGTLFMIIATEPDSYLLLCSSGVLGWRWYLNNLSEGSCTEIVST